MATYSTMKSDQTITVQDFIAMKNSDEITYHNFSIVEYLNGYDMFITNILYDYEDARTCFSNVHIDGGICYFLWNNNYIAFAEEYYACYGVRSVKSENVFALYEPKGDCADVFYAAFNDLKELKTLLHAQGVRRFSLTGSPMDPLFKNVKPEKRGMLRSLGDSELPDGFYIGITLD